jgi:hypothetical protein
MKNAKIIFFIVINISVNWFIQSPNIEKINNRITINDKMLFFIDEICVMVKIINVFLISNV